MKSDPAKQPSRSISNGESSSPAATSCTISNIPTLPSSMKLTNGHLVGALKQVSVQIERLPDIESLTPPLTPMKRSESPLTLSSSKEDGNSLLEKSNPHTPSPKRKDIASTKKFSSKGLPHGKPKPSNTRRSLLFSPSSSDLDSKDNEINVSVLDIDSAQMPKETNSVKSKSCLASVSRKRQLSRRNIDSGGKSDPLKDESELGDKKLKEENQNEKCSMPSCSSKTEANVKKTLAERIEDTSLSNDSSYIESGEIANFSQSFVSGKPKDLIDSQSQYLLEEEINEGMNVSGNASFTNVDGKANVLSDTDGKEHTLNNESLFENQTDKDTEMSETSNNIGPEDMDLSSKTSEDKRNTRTSPSKPTRTDSTGTKQVNNNKVTKPHHSLKKVGAVKESMKFTQNKRTGMKKLRRKRKPIFTVKKVRNQKSLHVTSRMDMHSLYKMPGISPRQAGSGAGQGHKSSNQRQITISHTPGREGSSGYDGHHDGSGQQPPPGGNNGNNDGNGESGGKKGDRKLKEPKIPDLKPCKVLVHKYVIRPAPVPAPPKYVKMEDGENHTLDQSSWMAVFKYLNNKELVQCLKVCKTWYRWVMHYSLWSNIDLNNTKIKQTHLIGIVKRQPQTMDLSYTNISFRQLEWLIARLPHLKSLNMAGNSWAAISAMCSSCCPLLTSLDISWVSGVYDQCIRDLLSPPVDHRPGVDDTTSRFHHCTSLTLTGCDITDKSLACIHHNLPKIEILGLCCCTKLTDVAVETIAQMPTIKELDISKCRGLTPVMFGHLKKMPNLRKVNIHACTQISEIDIVSFAQDIGGQYLHRSGLVIIDEKALEIQIGKITDNCESEMQC